ncbi:phage baseplate assembly protein V [Nocardia sp. NBC_00508]|uniref:phage baseplate assembly protein V n=1 Tax=Nocardia sp. NBC_00508 TaxID=2975992 RepID=UPI002E8239F4|nr:phage baseplate assembly protein V [Nocardia sp. NBC_00508]WUD66789.1 phage baseplate assembly protein V [Nocardia sp. NBC_00508]
MKLDTYVPRADIRISGVSLAADVMRHLISVRYDNSTELADMVTIVLDNANNRFTDSPLFELGKNVEIHLGYGNRTFPMMLGEIAAIEPDFPHTGPPTITIVAYDRSLRLRHDIPDRPAFRFVNDSAVAAQIALEAGLIPIVDPSPFTHTVLPQTTTDMALLKRRAADNFFDVYVWWDKLFFRYPRPQIEAVELEWGRNLTSFSPRVGNAKLAGIQVVRGYNEELAQSIVGMMSTAALDLDSIVERLGSNALSALTSLGRRVLRGRPVKSPVDAFALAKALLQQLLDGMYEAHGSCIGLPQLRANTFVSVRGVGKRFSGMYRLSKVTHTLDRRGYRTEFEVTQRAGAGVMQLVRKAIGGTPPPDQEESYPGVVIAEVMVVDPLTNKVGVRFPWFSDVPDLMMAPMMTPLAGKLSGTLFLPDPGDKVVVAFEHGKFANPVVLGSLRSLVDPPPPGAGPGQISITHKTGSSLTFTASGDIEMKAVNVKVKVLQGMDVSGPTP